MTAKKKKKTRRFGPPGTGIGHRFSVQIYAADEEALDELAAAQGRSRGWVIREMVHQALDSLAKSPSFVVRGGTAANG